MCARFESIRKTTQGLRPGKCTIHGSPKKHKMYDRLDDGWRLTCTFCFYHTLSTEWCYCYYKDFYADIIICKNPFSPSILIKKYWKSTLCRSNRPTQNHLTYDRAVLTAGLRDQIRRESSSGFASESRVRIGCLLGKQWLFQYRHVSAWRSYLFTTCCTHSILQEDTRVPLNIAQMYHTRWFSIWWCT